MKQTKLSEAKAVDFLTWLAQYRGHDTPLGDLADDFARDRGAPNPESLDSLIAYLIHKGACRECLRTAKSAWKKWKQ